MGRTWVSFVLGMTLCGCVSSLNVQRYDPSSPQVGYPYRLRLTQYQITATWRVVGCDPTGTTPLKIKTTAEVKETTALDPEQFYVIDPRSLQGLFRTTEFTMEWYEDRTPKSITSDADDQTGTAIGNVLQGVSKLAAAGLGFPAGPASNKCAKAVADALDGINGKPGDKQHPGQKAVTEAAQKAVDTQTALMTKLTADATAMGTTLDGITRRKLGQARARLEALIAVLTLEQGRLKELNDVLTDSRTITWPEFGSEFASTKGIAPSAAAKKRWNLDDSSSVVIFMRLTPLDRPEALAAAEPAPKPVTTVSTTTSTMTSPASNDGAWPRADGNGGAAAQPPKPAPTPTPPPPPPPTEQPTARPARAKPSAIPGLPYREPGRVRLVICVAQPCDGTVEELDTDRLIASTTGLSLQAGTMMYLPFRAQTFAHIKNSAGFAQSGVLTSAGSSQLRGAGSGTADAFKGASEQAGAIVDARRTAETKRLTAAADEAKARKALADAEAALSPNPNADDLAKIAAFQTEATLATAEKSVLDALAALAASKAAAGQ